MAHDHRRRSPLRERERSVSPQRRGEVDYGEDAEKHVRHITRTRQFTAFAGEEGAPHDWAWVLKGLAHRRFDQGPGCPVDILDTIIYCDGSPEMLYHTNGGHVVSKVIAEEEGCITLAKAMAHLRPPKKYAGALAADTSTAAPGGVGMNGAVAFTSAGEAVAIKTVDLAKIRKAQSTPPAGTVALVVLVPLKAQCAELLLSIQHTFVLEPCVAKPVHRSYRLVILKGVPKRIPCQSSTINKKLELLCKQVILWVEAYSGARVLRLVLEVVEDLYGDLWLVRSSECSTTKTVLPYRRQRRSPSPSQFKTARLRSAKGIADELSLLRYGHAIGESAPSPTAGLVLLATSPTGRGNQREPRPASCRRVQTAMSPAEAGSSQGTLDPEEWGFKISESPSSAMRDARRPQTVSAAVTTSAEMVCTSASVQARGNRWGTLPLQEDGIVRDIGVTFQGFAAAGEHDPREIGRTAAAGRALGSSQLTRMCHGDFCDTDLLDKIQQQARFEQGETGSGSRTFATSPSSSEAPSRGLVGANAGADDSAGTSTFRKRILKLDEATLQDHGVLPAEGGLVNVNHVADQQPQQKGRGKGGRPGGRGGVTRKGGRAGGGGRRSEQRRAAVDEGKAECADWKEVPRSWVVRGRQESHLINQQLRRYRRGNKEPFVGHLSGLGESSVSLGAVFPATYYQPVRVCGNCYRVYSMIDKARTRSVKRLDVLAAAASARGDTTTGLSPDQGRNGGSSDGGNKHEQTQRVAKRARSGAGPRRGEGTHCLHSNTWRENEEDGGIRNDRGNRGAHQLTDGSPFSSPAFPGSDSAKGEEEDEWDAQKGGSASVSGESLALIRAQAAIDELTRGDICELRSFAKPPAAVNMVAAALMIALTGQGEPTAAGWLSARRYMTNVDKLFAAVSGLDLNTLRVSQTRKLEAYVRNPAFRPDIVACVSLPASKICAWVLGVLEAHRWRTGRGHPRIDMLGQGPALGDSTGRGGHNQEEPSVYPLVSPVPSALSAVRTRQNNIALLRQGDRLPSPSGVSSDNIGSIRPRMTATASAPSRITAALGPAVYPFPSSAAAAAAAATVGLSTKNRCSRGQPTDGGSGETRPTTTAGFNPRTFPQPAFPPQAWVPAGVGSGSGASGATIGSPSRAGTAPATGPRLYKTNRKHASSHQPAVGSGNGGAEGKRSQASRAAAKHHQERVGERLANATAAAPDPAGFQRSEFLCADGVTLMPYAVVGTGASLLSAPAAVVFGGTEGGQGEKKGGGGGKKDGELSQEGAAAKGGVLSFVVVHDFFDTLEKTFLLFKPLVLKYPGCQVLCFNSPGQAGTRLPHEPEGLLTNIWVAERLDELMQHVDNMGEMPLSDRPFHLLGIGNGASIAAAFACHHASKTKWKATLRSLACVNGFATVDAQLAAVLHSAQRAFECFPPERPDLPISFWSRFVFSEDYLKSVGSDLALNILCAVANPLGAEGMLRIVKGALRSRDLTKDLKAVGLPLVLVQSTENMLINAANVDPFLEGRRPRHVWSHQLHLRATTTAAATAAVATNNGSNINGNSGRKVSSCLGPSGEQALFDSLSSGAEGAFIAWVKGGHETRQECKRLVVDVLDLLAAPSGQTDSFFQRGAQVKRPPGGRVGIAAKGKREAKTRGAVGITPSVGGKELGGGLASFDASGGSGRIDPTEREEGGNGRGTANIVMASAFDGTRGKDLNERERGRGGGGGDVGETHPAREGTSGAGEGERAAEEGGGRSGQTYGYASLRKIREREPLPEFPRSCGRRTHSPNARGTSPVDPTSSRTRLRSRALTAPVSPGQQSRRYHDLVRRPGSSESLRHHRHRGQGRGRALARTATGEWFGDGGAFQRESEDDNVGGGAVVTLEEAVADFDVALRDHRNKRKGLDSLLAPSMVSVGRDTITEAGGLSSSFQKRLAGGVDSPVRDTVASNWLDGEATSWATVDLGTDNDPREQPPWDEQREGVPAKIGGRASPDGDATRHGPGTVTAVGGNDTNSPTLPSNQVDAISIADADNTTSHEEIGAVGGVIKGVSLAQVEEPAATDRSGATIGEEEVEQVSVDSPPAAAAATTPCGSCQAPAAVVEDTTTTTPLVAADEAFETAARSTVLPATNTNLGTKPGAAVVTAPQIAQAMECPDPIATAEQRTAGDWMEGSVHSVAASSGRTRQLPAPLAVAEAEAGLAAKVDRLQSKRLAAEREERKALDDGRASKFGRERAARVEGFADEDRMTLAAESRRLAELRRQADLSRLQRGAEFEENDEALTVTAGTSGASMAVTTGATPMPVRGMRPQHFTEQEDIPDAIKKSVDHPADKVLDEMQRLEARAKAAGGGMNLEAFEKVEQRQRARQVERLGILHGQTAEEKGQTMLRMAVRLQMFARQRIARMRVVRLKFARSTSDQKITAAATIQSLVRGHLSRVSVRRVRRQLLDESILGGRATAIQRMYRGRMGRLAFISRLRDARSRVLQKAARGFLGRRVAGRKRALLAQFAARASSATKLQSAWRGKMARDNYLRARCSWLASREIQRMYRGHLGRRATRRRREWQAAGPGPERLKLGLRMIEDTKVAFAKQQGEIAALNTAQEKAEARVSSIHHQLSASESELSVLEGEMAEIDHIERELVQLTHERDLIARGITGAAGIPKTGKPRGSGGSGGGGGGDDDGDDSGGGSGDGGGGGGGRRRGKTGSRKEDAYALEMQLQLKRAEREQRRMQLSVEFASTFAEISDKKRQLDRLSAAVADIEATRLRKSREFGHMQRNLMELLSEQKRELDIVREKGVQLETAAATSAAAAAATAQRARDHEAKAAAMYGQTEELMKFQFMSMSLSYFSSLNMMKQMRDINADTTTAAITGSADAAAAAAASAAAASIPSLKQTGALGGDAVTQALALRKEQVKSTQMEIEEAEKSQRHPFPTELSLWTVDDVCRWLDTLQLGEYKQAFREGKVDGSFLGELREADLMDSIGMEHKLHLKKLLLARQKLTPLSAAEQSMASSVRREELATSIREEIPDIDTAFSQARHGKKKRLEETLNTGFDINAEDSMGNTLLLVAVQQLQMPVVEFLVQRGANVNHCNVTGNTSLHFAMSYDTSGKMGEYLINNGADDTIENKQGLSPYDGI